MPVLIKLLIVIFIFCCHPTMSQKAPPPFKKFNYLENNDMLPYGILSPTNLKAEEKYPLVIFLHGAGERGTDNEKHLKHIHILFTTSILNKYPCFVIAPQCPKGESWSDFMAGKPFSATPTKPMKLFLGALDKTLKEYPIDISRIYVTGVSMGGYGTWDLITRYPNRFAAAAPVCGGGDPKLVAKIKHIPIWAFHGALDRTVPPQKSRVMIDALLKVNATPGYTEYPDVEHNSWVHAYREPFLMPWFFKQKLTGSGNNSK